MLRKKEKPRKNIHITKKAHIYSKNIHIFLQTAYTHNQWYSRREHGKGTKSNQTKEEEKYKERIGSGEYICACACVRVCVMYFPRANIICNVQRRFEHYLRLVSVI